MIECSTDTFMRSIYALVLIKIERIKSKIFLIQHNTASFAEFIEV